MQLDNGKTVGKKTFSYKKQPMQFLDLNVDLAKHLTLNVEGYYKWFNQLSNVNRNKLFEENTDDVARRS